MVKSLKEWKQWNMTVTAPYQLNNKSAEYISQYLQDTLITKDQETYKKIHEYINYLIGLKLNKHDTINTVKVVFTNTSTAPDNINVEFIKSNLNEIVGILNKIPDEIFFQRENKFVDDMTNNPNSTFECAVYTNNNNIIFKKLSNTLTEKIKNKDFKCIYENNILYINNIDILTEKNKNILLNILKKYNVVNITESLKIKKILKNEKING